jgi:hypothetical protein
MRSAACSISASTGANVEVVEDDGGATAVETAESATVVCGAVGATDNVAVTAASDAVGTALEVDSLTDVPQPATHTNIDRTVPDRLARTERIVPDHERRVTCRSAARR